MSNHHYDNQQSEIPDYSNPYAYPSNPTTTQHYNTEDPALIKLKSAFWKNAGYLQSKLGSLTGSSSWEQSGQETLEEAQRKYQEAESQHASGAVPSRIYGEYDRFMGYLNYAVGHVAGDKEMQERANQRTKHGTEEIDKTT